MSVGGRNMGCDMEVEMEHRLTEVEQRTKSNSHRLDEVEKRQDNLDELVYTVKVLVVREETVEKNVAEIKSDVKAMASKPVKRWENLADKIFLSIVGALIGFILAQIGL